jgi:hypothetical protein
VSDFLGETEVACHEWFADTRLNVIDIPTTAEGSKEELQAKAKELNK